MRIGIRELLRQGMRAALLAVVAAPALAQTPGGGLVALNDVASGSLLLRTDEPGRYVRAPLVASSFDIDISGPVVRATVTQRFRNVSDKWVDGRYAFPLPDESAVDSLKMRIGGRFIEGVVKERDQARRDYEQARTEGRKAALVEQQRPNLFTNDVANIGPGDVVVVEIAWLQTLAPADGAFELRLPLVVAPRYNPKPVVHAVDFGPGGWAIRDRVPGREAIESPLADPREQPEGTIYNPVIISVDLQAGFPLGAVESRHHDVTVARDGDEAATVTLDGAVPADRDFVLRWTPDVGAAPHAALFRESAGGRDYYLALLTPPEPEAVTDAPARDVIFVQDVSGSMDGESIRQAREGLAQALRRLEAEDRFNIVFFNDRMWRYAPDMVPATPGNIAKALSAVAAMRADRGTEMLPALEEALADATPGETDRLRQVIFLTDGAVGNEAQMLQAITAGLGRSRLFTVGIGSAPNSYFMTRAAELGRGAVVYVDDPTEVAGQMAALFAKIENPVLTDLRAALPDGAGDLSPDPLPDLYAGDPVVFAFHTPEGEAGTVSLTAGRGGDAFEWRIDLAQAAPRAGIAKLWARKHIRKLEALASSQVGWEMGREKLDATILQAALDHRLVSRLTSLVAVDVTPSRPDGVESTATEVPLNLPAGWNAERFLDAPAPAPQLRKAALPQAELARLSTAAAPQPSGAPVPRGSLDWRARVLAGLLLLLMAIAGWRLHRRWPAGRTT
ncbi:marine proteobacterial sortase target protein [Minwuia thermotolerans]|uniref:Marine proteobacterial sortase target protein n=1 Tax=Minwuia thermotolerans TaxID=2056226 RepID=A0A2M9FVT0_9PROT|nr:marine proteobacterial sortase target protein [Minwuia thermotolerans]PJK27576.1 marine proteobacterial sortase target protein [Minwuia thermotolerans]